MLGVTPSLHNFTVPASSSNQLPLPTAGAERVLLLHPPVYDTRFHWHQWQQPTLLLRLATYLRRWGADVRLLDAIYHRLGEPLRRERVDVKPVDDLAISRWRFGLARSAIARQFQTWAKAGWHPDEVYVECAATFWWQGAAEVSELAKKVFPRTRVVLVGAYATLAPQHAHANTLADEVISEPWSGLRLEPTDLSLYETPPHFACLLLGDAARPVDEVINEVEDTAAKFRVRQFVIADYAVVRQYPELYAAVLEKLAERRAKVNLYALGNLSPSDVVAQPRLAGLMKQAGYVQLHFSDDRNASMDADSDEELVETYREAAELCGRAGFKVRTDQISAALCVGRVGEDLVARARVTTLVAHHVGSVILVPYQPSPSQLPDIQLEDLNGKFFPLRHLNQVTYRDYLDLLGLAVVLNAKYRSRSFDFLGDGLVSRLLRESVQRRAWEPDPEVKGTLNLPLVVR